MAQAVTTLPLKRTARRGDWWQLLLLWLLIPVLLVVAGIAWFEWSYTDRVFPGVQALGVDLSGMTEAEARTALEAVAAGYDLPPLAIRYGDRVWPLPAETLGVRLDVERLAQDAYLLGRTGDLQQNLLAQWDLVQRGREITAPVEVAPGAVATAVAGYTAQLNRAVVEPRLSLNDLQVVASSARSGQVVNVAATTAAVLDRFRSGRGGVVDVVVSELSTATADVSANQESFQRLLNRTIVLADERGDFQFALDPATLAGLLKWVADDNVPGGLRAEVQPDLLVPVVEKWARQVARPPLNARYDFDSSSNSLVELSPSATGYALDVATTVTATLAAIASGQTQVALPVQVLKPAVPSGNPASLGIKELVAQSTSSFAGSSADRVKNIEVAAAKLVGVVIPPGGTFSFNEHVGDVTAANGFEDSLIIAGDRTAVGVGGGVCQVSTTVFRAAWFGGFPLQERWNHGYVVRWYGEPGLDATVYTPRVDFKFRNTTDHHLLIKPIVDKAKGTMTFQFYGTKPNWTVEAAKPTYDKRTAPPAPLYIEDPNLAPGAVVQFDWAVGGLDAVAKRRVVAADGTVLVNDNLKSRYQPWQAKYRFGTGFQPPAGAEVQRIKR